MGPSPGEIDLDDTPFCHICKIPTRFYLCSACQIEVDELLKDHYATDDKLE